MKYGTIPATPSLSHTVNHQGTVRLVLWLSAFALMFFVLPVTVFVLASQFPESVVMRSDISVMAVTDAIEHAAADLEQGVPRRFEESDHGLVEHCREFTALPARLLTRSELPPLSDRSLKVYTEAYVETYNHAIAEALCDQH